MLCLSIAHAAACGGRADDAKDGPGGAAGDGDGDDALPPGDGDGDLVGDGDQPGDGDGDQPGDGDLAGDGDGDGDADGETPPPIEIEPGRITIPMVPVESGSVAFYFVPPEEIELGDAGYRWDHIEFDPPWVPELHFALGEGYPSHFRMDLDGSSAYGCSNFIFDEQYLLTSVESSSPSVVVTSLDGDGFRIELASVGAADLHIEGVFLLDDSRSSCQEHAGTEIPFSGTARATVHEPAGVVIDHNPHINAPDCPEPLFLSGHYLSSAPTPSVRVVLQSSTGEAFQPANATPDRPATLVVEGTSDTDFSLLRDDRGISQLRVVGPSQSLTVDSPWGPVGSYDVVQGSEVTEMLVDFELLLGRTAEILEPGVIYPYTSAILIAAFPHLYVTGREVCFGAGETEFVLLSDSPDVCPIQSESTTSADLIGAGACTLTLTAPGLGAAGLESGISVEFEEPPE